MKIGIKIGIQDRQNSPAHLAASVCSYFLSQSSHKRVRISDSTTGEGTPLQILRLRCATLEDSDRNDEQYPLVRYLHVLSAKSLLVLFSLVL